MKRGPKPFGYVPEEKMIIDKICFLRDCSKKSFQEIADTLNAESLPMRKGGHWNFMRCWQVYKKAMRLQNAA
jgi:hypothetical protein